ncbi:hypothetical protein ACN42_g11833 [Penicillium freii]|uniref:Uncharacterized protein n=1 Tax=Penicillium freii TaxID=48697 RepID=A0A101M7H9_PENFR|nr:hypothetical protein ACN42_g11833 [Penicillium freii]
MGSNPSPSAEEETPDRMSVDPTSVSPVLDPNLNPMDETDLPDVGAISLSSPESLRREGHPKKEEEEEEERQRRRMRQPLIQMSRMNQKSPRDRRRFRPTWKTWQDTYHTSVYPRPCSRTTKWDPA